MKETFNTNFGSVFRTYTSPTKFAFNLQFYADVYTSKIENLLKYPLNYFFLPKRYSLPHEVKTRNLELNEKIH